MFYRGTDAKRIDAVNKLRKIVFEATPAQVGTYYIHIYIYA